MEMQPLDGYNCLNPRPTQPKRHSPFGTTEGHPGTAVNRSSALFDDYSLALAPAPVHNRKASKNPAIHAKNPPPIFPDEYQCTGNSLVEYDQVETVDPSRRVWH